MGSNMDAGIPSPVGQFTLTVQQSPSDGAYATTQTPTFSWAAAPGAVKYEFYLSNASAIDYSGAATSSGSKLTKYTPASPLAYGKWYWGVCVTVSSGFRDCTINPWVVVITPALPPAPTGLSLNVTSPTKYQTPTFTWNVVTQINAYGLQLDTVPSFAHPAAKALMGTDYTPTADLADGNYYWRVRAINNNGAAGKWSATETFTVDTVGPPAPLLLSPFDNAITTNPLPTFKWAKSAGASSYELFVQWDSGGSASDKNYHFDRTFTSTSYTLSTKNGDTPLTAGVVYYWGIYAHDAAGNASPAPVAKFLLYMENSLPPALAAPKLSSPVANARIGSYALPITFRWALPKEAISTINLTSHLEVSDILSFGEGQYFYHQDITSGNTSFSPWSPPWIGPFYWRVRVYDSTNPANSSPWSPVWSFTYSPIPPANPTLLAPPFNSLSSTRKPTFSWTAVPGAVSYTLQYSINSGSPSIIPLITKTSYTPSTPLAYGEVTGWTVKAVDAYGNPSVPNVSGGFYIPLQNSPAPGAITSNTQPTFKWATFLGTGVTYDLHVDGLTTGTTNSFEEDNISGTSYTLVNPAESLKPGGYAWYISVNGVTPPPAPNPPYDVYPLFISSPVPSAPGLLYPANKAALGPKTPPIIIVSNVAYASKFEVQVSPFSNFLPQNPSPITFDANTSLTTTIMNIPLGSPAAPYPPTGGHQTYYWRVRGLSSSGAPGAWSAVRTFTYYEPPLAAPNLLSPAKGGAVTNPQLSLSWTAVPNAAGYYLWFAAGSAPLDTDPPNIQLGKVTSYKLPATIAEGTYYWTVEAYDPAGNTSTWISPQWFTVLAGQTVPKPSATLTAELTLTAGITPAPSATVAPTEGNTSAPMVSPSPTEPAVEPSPSPTPTEPTVEPTDAPSVNPTPTPAAPAETEPAAQARS